MPGFLFPSLLGLVRTATAPLRRKPTPEKERPGAQLLKRLERRAEQEQAEAEEEKAFRILRKLERRERKKSDRQAERDFEQLAAEVEAEFLTPEPELPPELVEAQAGAEQLDLDTEEGRFLAGETITGFQSSNVAWFSYELARQELTVSYKDGTVYGYGEVSRKEALGLLRAGSKGKWVWDHLRKRGTVFGYQKPYWIINAFGVERVWDKTLESRLRHGAIPPSGEPFKGYHPLLNPFLPMAQPVELKRRGKKATTEGAQILGSELENLSKQTGPGS